MTNTITVNNVQLKSDNNIEFSGTHKNKNFKITKDLDSHNQEFLFHLEVKTYNQYAGHGTYHSIHDCLDNI